MRASGYLAVFNCPEAFRGFSLSLNQPTLIQIESVSKQYGSSHAGVLALDDVSLDVRAGEFLSIIGPSGCGKSTLLKMIGDLLAPNAGQIHINQKSPADSRRTRECGIVFQSPTLMEWLTRIGFCLAYVAGMQALACAIAICRSCR